jgi:hypothetical protein
MVGMAVAVTVYASGGAKKTAEACVRADGALVQSISVAPNNVRAIHLRIKKLKCLAFALALSGCHAPIGSATAALSCSASRN